ncbi:MAG: right-handed parallel beta-helix repeat-containing protein [Acidobacteria bacterium]|nr:right-handed parallel beta-helix repeat-containing protein [Acidobacteriota bacterium]
MPLLLLVLILLAAAPAGAATIVVRAGGDLQAAINAAKPGDEIVLDAGARFVGQYRLPAKAAGGAVITIRSSAALPDRRITPADASLLPTIVSSVGEAALFVENTANWKIDGVQFGANVGGEGNVVHIQNSVNIVLDRILIVAPSTGQKRGVMGNGRAITLTRSHISGIWRAGQDSQAFCAWDGAGPYTITDNYLEAASENLMFGGANSQSSANVPADILVERNHITKPLAWKGTPKAVKNLFELKSAKRVVIRNNLFENNWTDAQNGYAILFTGRNDEGQSPWSVVEDVLFERNIVRNTENGINILGYDSYQPSGRTTRVTIRHNLVITAGTFMQIGSEVGELTVDHNTVEQGHTFAMLYGGSVWAAGTAQPRSAQFAVEKLIITNTLAYHRDYGVFGEDAGVGIAALAKQARTYSWSHNVLAGPGSEPYPSVTWRPSIQEHQAQFESDYSLTPTSKYRQAGKDGADLGVVWSGGSPGMSKSPPPRNLRVIIP